MIITTFVYNNLTIADINLLHKFNADFNNDDLYHIITVPRGNISVTISVYNANKKIDFTKNIPDCSGQLFIGDVYYCFNEQNKLFNFIQKTNKLSKKYKRMYNINNLNGNYSIDINIQRC